MRTENELSAIAIDIAIKIHKILGPGLLENIYEAALAYELKPREINFTRQQGIPVIYERVDLGIGFRADLILENKLIIELKSIQQIEKVHHKILLTYLRLTGIKLGLILNFNQPLLTQGIVRKVNNL